MKFSLDDIDINTQLSNYSFDSIIFTELANKLNQEYCINLTSTIFLNILLLVR